MSNDTGIFKKINDAVLDLQSAGHQSYERPLKTLVRLLKDPVLADVNHEITKDVDLAKFLEESEHTQGGMVGSARLLWPDDPKQTLGLTYLLICKFGDDPEYMLQFGFYFYHSGRCRIPDDCIDSKRYPLFMAREVMRQLMDNLCVTSAIKPGALPC